MIVFSTERLSIRTASTEDASLYLALWNDPKVMTNAGFSFGLRITLDEVEAKLREQEGDPGFGRDPVFGRNMVVDLQESATPIGECKMYQPNEEGIAKTDIKLLPEFWGHRYGVEVKRGLLSYLFEHTDSKAVEATPNVQNMASIKTQEAVGGERVGEEIYYFPDSMKEYTCPVHHYVYLVSKEKWTQGLEDR